MQAITGKDNSENETLYSRNTALIKLRLVDFFVEIKFEAFYDRQADT